MHLSSHKILPSHVQPSLPSCLRAFDSPHLIHEANFTLRLPVAVIMDAPEKSSLNLMCQKLGRLTRGLECCLQVWMQQACIWSITTVHYLSLPRSPRLPSPKPFCPAQHLR